MFIKTRKLAIGILVLTLIMSLILVGCGNNNAENNTDNNEGENQSETTEKSTDFPKKPITLVCQFAAGGAADLLARPLASAAEKSLGQPVVVENKAGSSGTIGTDYVLKSNPDGYTLLTSASGNFTTTPVIQKAPYDPIKDVRHIIGVAADPLLLVVSGDSEWKTLDDFVKYAKAHPGELKYGNNAPGGTNHLCLEKFQKAAGFTTTSVPYSTGSSEVIAAILGNHVDIGINSPMEVKEFLKTGKLRALVAFAEDRIESLPDVPTAKELGYDTVVEVYRGVSGPADMPDEVVQILHDAFKKAMEDEDFIKAVKNTGAYESLDYKSGEELAAAYKAQYEDFSSLLKELGLVK